MKTAAAMLQEMDLEENQDLRIATATQQIRRSQETLAGLRKAAILCASLGDDAISEVFRYLEEDEVQKISREIASLRQVPSEQASEVLREFDQLLTTRNYVVNGGIEYAKRLITKAYGPDTARRLLEKIMRSLESTVGFEALQKIDPQQLSKLFQNEHPQTIALVLAHLDSTTSAATLRCLPEAQRADIVLRMASLQSISQDVIRQISIVLDHKMKAFGSENRQEVGGIRPVAEICNRLERDVSQKMLEQIENVNPDLALAIRNLMMTFDDLLLVDDAGIREILQRVDKKALAMALKGTSPELQARFFGNMSSKAVEMMKEEMDFMGQVRVRDVTAAQREVVEVMRELDEQGVISITGSDGGDDGYVS